MLSCADFYQLLKNQGVDFFTGVPDSLLKSFCAYVTEHTPRDKHIIAANEGGAVGLAMGYHLATGKTPLIYLQNSGLGNIINPLLSLASPDIYSTPMLLMLGWRGEPDVKDEPQHKTQGRVMLQMLEAMEIDYEIIDKDSSKAEQQIKLAIKNAEKNKKPVALIICKNTFDAYKLNSTLIKVPTLVREQAIKTLCDNISDTAFVVSTTGMISRELFEARIQSSKGHQQDFLCIGGMGHAAQIALGVALAQPDREVYCLDGDGAVLMHMGAMAIIGQNAPANFKHIVINNGAHQSVGGQPTVGFDINFCDIAKAVGYNYVMLAKDKQEILSSLSAMQKKLSFLEIHVNLDYRNDLGRPTSSPQEAKQESMRFLQL